MRYKPSKFNHAVRVVDGGSIIYNSYTGSLGKVDVYDNELVVQALGEGVCDDENNPSAVIKALIRMGYLIEEDVDESIKLNYLSQFSDGGHNLQLTILPTEQCNFRCVYCYEDFIRGKMSKEMQDALISFVKKNLKNYTNLHVSWFGGEPLMALDVIEYLSDNFIEICKRAKKPYTASITSNGYLLTVENFKKLVSRNVLTYQITVDGTKQTHDKQKPLANGDKTFDSVINNLKEIRDKVKTGVFKVIIRTNVTKEIFESLEEYVDFYHEMFDSDPRFEFFLRPAGDWGGDNVHKVESSLLDTNEMAKVFEKCMGMDKTLRFNIYRSFYQPCGSICYAAYKNNFTVDSDGNIRKCTCNLNSDEDNKIGEMKLNGVADFDMYKMSKWAMDREINQECKECFYLPACFNRSCPIKRINNRKRITCPYEKLNIDMTLQLMNHIGNIERISGDTFVKSEE